MRFFFQENPSEALGKSSPTRAWCGESHRSCNHARDAPKCLGAVRRVVTVRYLVGLGNKNEKTKDATTNEWRFTSAYPAQTHRRD
jgi:hypothetical protein